MHWTVINNSCSSYSTLIILNIGCRALYLHTLKVLWPLFSHTPSDSFIFPQTGTLVNWHSTPGTGEPAAQPETDADVPLFSFVHLMRKHFLLINTITGMAPRTVN